MFQVWARLCVYEELHKSLLIIHLKTFGSIPQDCESYDWFSSDGKIWLVRFPLGRGFDQGRKNQTRTGPD